jgi:hypothetical protein
MKFPLPWLQSQACQRRPVAADTHVEHRNSPDHVSHRTKARGDMRFRLFSSSTRNQCANNKVKLLPRPEIYHFVMAITFSRSHSPAGSCREK